MCGSDIHLGAFDRHYPRQVHAIEQDEQSPNAISRRYLLVLQEPTCHSPAVVGLESGPCELMLAVFNVKTTLSVLTQPSGESCKRVSLTRRAREIGIEFALRKGRERAAVSADELKQLGAVSQCGPLSLVPGLGGSARGAASCGVQSPRTVLAQETPVLWCFERGEPDAKPVLEAGVLDVQVRQRAGLSGPGFPVRSRPAQRVGGRLQGC